MEAQIAFSDEQLSEITDRYIRGENIHSIAHAVGVPASQILTALQDVYEKLKVAIPFKFNDASIIQLSKLDKAESEAWKSWELSKRPKQRKSSKATKMGGGENAETDEAVKPDKMEQQLNTEERDGSPAYLNIVLNCVKLRVELLRL